MVLLTSTDWFSVGQCWFKETLAIFSPWKKWTKCYNCFLLLENNQSGTDFQFHTFNLSYLQAGRMIFGMWMNTIEKGATIIGSDEFTCWGSNGGMFPDEFTDKMFPFSSTVWLCRFPSLAVKWYSSLKASPSRPRGRGIRTIFDLCLLDLCLWCNAVVLLNAIPAWTVLLPSRLSNSNVIPFCKIES